jgi:hypothetical protein
LSDHAALPSNDDWVFRIKVISSSTAPDEDIFRGAVQGLVKICFPQGVLEEMGVDVVKQHMREGKAPDESIARMAVTYGMEMVHRITEMLAEYLDTPAKVESAIKSIIATSSNLHIKVGDEVFADIARSLAHQGRQESAPRNAVTTTVETDHPPNITKKRKNKAGQQNRKHGGDEMLVDAEEPTQGTKRISASWRWNIELDGASAEALTEAFQRPADLFAFHALPIVRGMLEADAKRKELRRKMQDMLDEMPDEEYDKWIESFQKLHDGDEVMLVRIPPNSVSTGRTAATPAPVDSRRYAGNAVPERHSEGSSRTQSVVAEESAQRLHSVKREGNNIHITLEDEERRVEKPENDVATTTAAFPHLSTERPDTIEVQHAQCLQAGSGSTSTPIVDLLWGSASFISSARPTVVRHIMQSINQRIIKPVSLSQPVIVFHTYCV